MVSPYPFKGGNISDYETYIGKAGTYNTRYIPTGESIPCVQPADSSINNCHSPTGLDMLQIANLGLGILNLGVGVYNAFKLNNVEKLLNRNHEQIQGYFGNIQNALNAHQRTLEVLLCNQYDLSQKMDILREEMHCGFQQIVQEIQDTEANRRKREFYANTYELLEVYERFVDHLPDLSEADRLINRAEKLEAILQAELSQIPPSGKAYRLPLVTALSFSVRAKADAFEAKGGNYINSADRALNKLKEQILREAHALCDGSSIYTIGVQMPEILYQYALLLRGIDKGLKLRRNSEIEFVFSPNEIIWDDGLDALRSIFNKSVINSAQDTEKITEKTPISLNTLPEYDWYIRFAGKDKLTFDVHSCKEIKLSKILEKIGHPIPKEGAIRKTDLGALMLFSLPETAERFEHFIQEEFCWIKRPRICRSSDRLEAV
jgi:hypothetical protein